MTSAISCPLWSSLYRCQRVEGAFTSLFCSAWMCCLRRYIHVCNCYTFSVVNVYLDHLKLCVVCIDGRRYVCCSECIVVSNECDEPLPALCNLSARTVVMLCTLGVFAWFPEL